MEFFDVYDASGRFLNKSVKRGTKLKKGEYFMVVHVWIEGDDGAFLIQKRAKTNDPIPHQWAVTSGLTSKGEGPRESAIREVYEEIGLSLSPTDLESLTRILSDHNHYHTITHVYYTDKGPKLDALSLDTREVLDVDYVLLSTILDMVENQTFWDYNALLGVKDYFSILKRGKQ